MRTAYSRGNSRGVYFIVVDRQLQTSRQNSQQSQGHKHRVTGRTTAKPVRRRRRKKKQSPSALARSRKRHVRFLEKKLVGKPDLALPEEKSITTVPGAPDDINSLRVKDLENTSLTSGCNRDLVSLKIQHQAQNLIQTYQ